MKLFNEMLESTRELKREDYIPIIMKKYEEMIEKYPDTFRSEEAYYRMMRVNLREFYPPREEEAERLYREYFKKYKNPRVGMAMNGDLARHYFKHQRWEKLARFQTTFIKEYVKSGKYGDTLFLYLYTEAKFHLKDYEEARRGYQIIKRNFKGKRNAMMAEKRLEQLKTIMDSGGK
jgi:outer membrane protein assembly factor BamD (BamD/ComL family)